MMDTAKVERCEGDKHKTKAEGDSDGIVPARLSPAIPNEATAVIADRQPSDGVQSTPSTRPLARTPGLPSAVGDG